PPAGFGSVIVLADPKLDDLPDPQRDYIRDYVQSMEDALIADQNANWATRNYLNYLDRAAWVDYHILINLSKTADGMQRSSFLYKDRGDRLKAGPLWDLDRSMHSYDHAQRDGDWASWTNIEGDTLWTYSWWGVLTRDPDYRQDWVDRWQTLRLTTFANDHLTRLADDLAAEIGPEAFARDAARWELGSSFSSEMDRVKNWLVQRSGWIDSQFVAAPHLAREGDRIRVTPPAGASVVYTTDGTDPRLSGGGIASHATILTGPALLNESDAVRLRSYDAAQVNSYPGSPWSRAVLLSSASSGGPASINLFDGHASARSGETVTIGPDGDFRSGLSFEWHYNSVRIPGAAEPRLKLDAAAPSQSGIYVLTVRENGIQVGTAQYTVNISVFANLVNLSARAEVGSGNDVLIGGFVVRGAGTKNFLVRAVGPSLREQGIATPLAAPTLRVYKADGSIHASNTGWLTSPDATEIATAAARVGAFALSSHGLDSALLLRVPGGIYTLHVGGASGQGIGLAEIYALDENSSPLNLSARARVAADDGLLIGGLVIDGHDHKRVLIRAVGPTLAEHGLANELLLDPEFQVLSRAVPLYANDNWSDAANAAEIASTAAAVGAFPLRQGSADAALVVDLAPGAYTVLVRGKNRTEGIA
ncbi:MAG TPA: CotH kinase family protein, partial [Opitutus sp.]|nr:CotH kinase family protein [Opitutus sp.]